MKKRNLFLFAAFVLFIVCGCMKGVKTMQYDNGVKVIMINDKDATTSSVNVFVRTGAIDEKPSQAGLSHFIEHLIFKGSKNYTGDELSRRVENMGGYINAATSKEYTVFYINIQKDGVSDSIKMLADAMENPLFPKEEIDKERKVVIEEIQRYSDNPFSVMYEKFLESAYEKSAYKNSVIGTADVIANVSRNEILDYFKTNYVPGKMVVCVCGNFDKKEVLKLLNETFGKLPKKDAPKEPIITEDSSKKTDIILKKDVEVGYFIMGFLGPDIDNEDIYKADIAMSILGGGKTSRLYKVLKEDKKLVYTIASEYETFKGTGIACTYAVFKPENLNMVKEEIIKQIEEIIKSGISIEELDRAKLSAKSSWYFGLEKPSDIAYTNGFWTLMGKKNFPKDYIENIDKLTQKDLCDFFVKYYGENGKDKIVSVSLLPKDK